MHVKRPVIAYKADGTTMPFPSIKEAAKATGANPGAIGIAIRSPGQRDKRKAKGWYWKFSD